MGIIHAAFFYAIVRFRAVNVLFETLLLRIKLCSQL